MTLPSSLKEVAQPLGHHQHPLVTNRTTIYLRVEIVLAIVGCVVVKHCDPQPLAKYRIVLVASYP